MEEVIHICYVNYIVNEQNIISTNQRENKSTNMLRWYGRPVDITVDKSMNFTFLSVVRHNMEVSHTTLSKREES